jgi:hypothetical protein
VDAEFSVELGGDDPTLAVPWRSPDGATVYVDLRSNPSKIDELSEVRQFPELVDFLRLLNSGRLATAKCDAWFDQLMDVDDEPYEAKMKCASYVDVFLVGESRLSDFALHESVVRRVTERLRTSEIVAGRVEIIIRRAYFGEDDPETGYYWTVYVFGYGDGLENARSNWSKALHLVQTALLHA